MWNAAHVARRVVEIKPSRSGRRNGRLSEFFQCSIILGDTAAAMPLTFEQNTNMLCGQGAKTSLGRLVLIKEGKSCGPLAFDRILSGSADRARPRSRAYSEGALGSGRRRFAGRPSGSC